MWMSLWQLLAKRKIEKARKWNQQQCKAAKLPGHAGLTNWSPKQMSCSCEVSYNWGYFLSGVCWRLRGPYLENTRSKKMWNDSVWNLVRMTWDANMYHKMWRLQGASSWICLKKKCFSPLTMTPWSTQLGGGLGGRFPTYWAGKSTSDLEAVPT